MRAFLVHLRLHFQAILAGIFLWAFLLAGGVPDARALAAFVVLHVLLYGGTTAYNAWTDQDEGPITGLRHPPRAGKACLWGGLGFMLLGALLAPLFGLWFALIYIVIALLSIGYSHPRVRWKRSPAASLLVVAFGQGVLGFLAGAVIAARGLPEPTPALLWGGAAATLLTTGLYPLTQVFQVEEDLSRGDRTFAASVGPRRVFRTTLACFAVALLCAIPAARTVFTPAETIGLVAALALSLVVLALWSRHFDARAVLQNHDRVLLLGLAVSVSFSAIILRHLGERLR